MPDAPIRSNTCSTNILVSAERNTEPKNESILDAGSLPRTGEQHIVELVTTKSFFFFFNRLNSTYVSRAAV